MSRIQAIQAVNRRTENLPTPEAGDLRVIHFPQVPCDGFVVPVVSLAQARLVVDVLADYDMFQLAANIKPDFCNATVVEIYCPDETEEDYDGWCDWYDTSSREFSGEFSDLTANDISEIDHRLSRG